MGKVKRLSDLAKIRRMVTEQAEVERLKAPEQEAKQAQTDTEPMLYRTHHEKEAKQLREEVALLEKSDHGTQTEQTIPASI